MNGIGLSSTQLARFSHHWFWGLRAQPSAGTPTLYDMALALEEHPEKSQEIVQQWARVAAYGFIIQSVFWVFNIQHYRTHYYQFQSQRSWQFYQERVNMMSHEEQQRSEAVGGFTFVFKSIQSRLPSMTWFYNVIQPYVDRLPHILRREGSFDSTISDSVSDDDTSDALFVDVGQDTVDDGFVITASMLGALKTLGLEKQPGEMLALSKLKAGYRDQLLQSHPDKTGTNSQRAFLAVREAMQTMMEAINQHGSEQTTSSPNENVINKQWMAEVDEMIERERAWLRVLREQTERYSANVDQYCANVSEITAEVKEVTAGVAKLIAADAARDIKIAALQKDIQNAQLAAKKLKEKIDLNLTKQAGEQEWVEMSQSYEAVDACRPVHELKRNHVRLFKPVLSDIQHPSLSIYRTPSL